MTDFRFNDPELDSEQKLFVLTQVLQESKLDSNSKKELLKCIHKLIDAGKYD